MKSALRLVFPASLLVLLASCSSSGTGAVPDGGTTSSSSGGSTSDGSTGFAGAYNATFAGTYQNTSPNTESGTSTSSAVITVTTPSPSEVELSWQVAPNPPSGTAIFLMSGSSGTLADAGVVQPPEDSGIGVGGSCFTGTVNGNTQTDCCTTCSISFSGATFTQPNSGYYTGKTPAGVAYQGTYSGTWTGTHQ